MRLVNGDIFDCKENLIIHQVNCKGVMGRGLALDIASRYPKVFEQYKTECSKYGSRNLGRITATSISSSQAIVNIFAQDSYGTDRQYTDYEAFEKCIKSLAGFAKKNNLSIAIPFKIGCNLAGGKWKVIRNILEKELKDCNCTIYRKARK